MLQFFKFLHKFDGIFQINDYLFASGSFDKSIKIWDINNFNCVNTIYGHNDLILFIFAINNL